MTMVSRHLASSDALQHCTICHECDLLVDMHALQEGHRALCPRCKCVLSNAYPQANVRILVFALTAIICLIMSQLFDFVELKVAGQLRNITLPETVATLFALNEWTLAVFMGGIIVVLPLLFMGALLWLVLQLQFHRTTNTSLMLLHIIRMLQFWNMAEIFFLGILISMVKVAGMAHVSIGPSFWFYGGFNFCMILALYHVDKYQLISTTRMQMTENDNSPGQALHDPG